MYKAGQIITFCGYKFRFTNFHGVFPCGFCAKENDIIANKYYSNQTQIQAPCEMCVNTNRHSRIKTIYPKLIKQCGKQDK